MRVLPEAADGLKAVVRDKVAWLDGLLAGRKFLAGDRFTLADIVLYSALDFGTHWNQAFDPNLKNVKAFFDRVAERPSAKATAG
jgi:glutathione S-transferase